MKQIGLKKKFYNVMVDSHPLVSREYYRYLDTHSSVGNYERKIAKIVQLNWKYRICRQNVDCNLNRLRMPEGNGTDIVTVDEVVKKAMKYDVISFDIFDTLIFRCLEKPGDVFRLLEAQWNIAGFKKMREDAEQLARKKQMEINIYDIYKILSCELSINLEQGVKREIEMEKKVCRANPYMFQIYERLFSKKKKLIAVSDMYIPKEEMRELLSLCGYNGLDDVFVSCEYYVGKGNGQLQKCVMQKYGQRKQYIHIGDNKRTDINGSKVAGWDTIYYPNINNAGARYRIQGMKSIASAAYKGIVNGKLHSGCLKSDPFYELGYVNGGIMAVGFCQFLNELCIKEQIDQFLFVARDGYIVHKIYNALYKKADNAYVPFSRFASYQLTMERNWKNFLKQVVFPRTQVKPSETIQEVLKICDMEYIGKYLSRYGLQMQQRFDKSVINQVEKIFIENIDEIERYHEQTVDAAKEFFHNVIGSHKKICVVDIGWQGTGAICLKYFLEEKCGMNIKVCGALMGMSDSETAELSLSSKNLFAYMFSAHHNRDILQKHMGRHNDFDYRNLLIEMMFTEAKPSFLKFQRNEKGEVTFLYGVKENNRKVIKKIQRGIYDFAVEYAECQKRLGDCLNICGQEAYMPINHVAEARKYAVHLLGNYEINENPGIYNKAQKRTFKEIVS